MIKGANLKLKAVPTRGSAANSGKEKVGTGANRKVVRLFPKKSRPLTARQREQLIVDNRIKARKLARSILRKWHSRLDLQEVDSIVDLSLCEAVRRYNPAFGASFITFLYYHMRGNLIRAVADAASLNLIPVTDAELESTANGEVGSNGDRRGANAIEIAQALNSEDFPLPDERLMKKELVMLSNEACGKLDALEREVIERIYLKEQQLIDVASQLGYSRCHISRVKRKALETLYTDLATSLDLESKIRLVEVDDSEGDRLFEARRKVHRRRPRAKKSIRELIEPLAAVG